MKMSYRSILSVGGIVLLAFASTLATPPNPFPSTLAAPPNAGEHTFRQLGTTISVVGEDQVIGSSNNAQGLHLRGEPCVLCPADADVIENEPTRQDQTDNLNGTCTTATPVSFGDVVCGKSNGFINTATGGNMRDIDLFTFELTQATNVRVAVRGSLPTLAQLLANGDCSGNFYPVATNTFGIACDQFVLSASLAPGLYTVLITSLDVGPTLVPEYDYVFKISDADLVTFACCDFDGNCTEVLPADCDGFLTASETCAEVTCLSIPACPLGANVEGFGFGEFLFDGYVDSFNSGCNIGGGAFAIIDIVQGGDVWCGSGGHFITGGFQRDTDWYQLEVFAPTELNWRVTSTFGIQTAIIQAGADNECFATFRQILTGPAGVPVDNIATIGPGTYFLFVSTNGFIPIVPSNAPYIAEVIFNTPSTESCCFTDGSCEDLVASDCRDQGGIVGGPGSSCATANCCSSCTGAEVQEGEDDCFNGRTDDYNAGCNFASAFNTTPLSANTPLCGTAGTFYLPGPFLSNPARDTDWYSYDHPGGPFTYSAQAAGFDILIGIIDVLPDGSNCGTAAFTSFAISDGCTPVSIDGDLPAGTYILFAATADFEGVPCSFEYTIEVTTGPTCDPDCADVTGELDVNLADLNLVLANFGQTTSNGDANCDGQVNLADLNLVLSQFGTTCP
jgi:hypothetical protein